MRGTEKITAGHRERTALIYVRQSSLAQVRDNTESTARQYALADEAVRLGWARQSVEVIDADLGLSGRSAERRSGFKDLVGRVCVGEVGAIFGLEVSRLARSSADLSRLLELARLTDTLVVDADGIYDLANFNDRLLLGLKGTMSEAELHLLAGRLQGAKRAAAERGELRFPLPVGLVYDDDGNTIIDPDAEVQAAVADVFAAFRAGGSAYQVVAAFKGRRFPLRAYGGVWAGQLRWGRLTHSRVLGILANPSYAGVYVFGRYRSRRVVSPDGVVSTKTVELPREEWPVVIHDHHPGYISWDDYLANQARLAANLTNAGARPPREGHALCQGIIGCGSCGRPMTTRYHRNGHAAYECSASRADQMATATCRSITAVTVDDAVAERLLDALNPDEVALALAAADEPDFAKARIGIRWHTGATDELVVSRRQDVTQYRRTDPAAIDLARSLSNLTNHDIAERLNAAGYVTGAGRPFDNDAIASLRHYHQIPQPGLLDDGEVTVAEVARRLGISHGAVIHWIARGWLPARRGLNNQWCISFSPEVEAACRHHVAQSAHIHEPDSTDPQADQELTVAEVAAVLGISTNVVYYWIERRHVVARRGAGGRLFIGFGPDVEAVCRARVAASVRIKPVPQPQTPRSTTQEAV